MFFEIVELVVDVRVHAPCFGVICGGPAAAVTPFVTHRGPLLRTAGSCYVGYMVYGVFGGHMVVAGARYVACGACSDSLGVHSACSGPLVVHGMMLIPALWRVGLGSIRSMLVPTLWRAGLRPAHAQIPLGRVGLRLLLTPALRCVGLVPAWMPVLPHRGGVEWPAGLPSCVSFLPCVHGGIPGFWYGGLPNLRVLMMYSLRYVMLTPLGLGPHLWCAIYQPHCVYCL